MKHSSVSKESLANRSRAWQEHEFYQKAIVLGLDIGLDGIGIYLRRGLKEVFARTLDFELPQPEALANRRQKRAWRHCRKNRARRLHRLKMLFEKHKLPWLSEDRMSRANPFRERYRAATKGVASPEALSICIRHCVTHRGFDYGGTEEGRYPWGNSDYISAASTWLSTAVITPEMADHLQKLTPELSAKKNLEEQRSKFVELVLQRLDWSGKNNIERVLQEHSKGGHDNLRLRARGYNFPRSKVWEHLERIVRNHPQFISDVEGFLGVLGLNPNRERNEKSANRARKKAIFFYNRKTRFEMQRHWDKKVKACPFARRLGLDNPEARCDLKEDLAVRRWSVLEFASTRRVELDLVEGKGKTRKVQKILHAFDSNTVQALVKLAERHNNALAKQDKSAEPKREDAVKLLEASIAAKHGEKVKPSPQTKSEWNKSFFTQLYDLLFPTAANRKKRASLCAASAAKLYDIAAKDGTDFAPDGVTARLKAAGFYNWRRDPTTDFNPYPQVECLLGKRAKHGKSRGELSATNQGLLRHIFNQCKKELDGAQAPDYCIVELIGDIPRNTQQRSDIEKEKNERREKRQGLFEEYNLEDQGIASKRRRIQLYHQQHGRCPYTGEMLPANPLDLDLEIEHIFPEELGGLSMDENLVLTWHAINSVKGKKTPYQAAQGGASAHVGGKELRFLPWEDMLRNTLDMRWGKKADENGCDKKRDIFAWGTKPEQIDAAGKLKVPNFGNTTRVAQLARQLRAEVARWMKVDDNPDEAARRIGVPSGWLAAQARKSWLAAEDYTKVRSNMVHHLIDAAVLAHIPPREGMNHVNYGGIFYTQPEPVRDVASGRVTDYRLVTKALADLSPTPRLKHWLSDRAEYAVCPVLKLRSRSKTKELGDGTFWKQASQSEPTLVQRTVLDVAKIGSPEELLSILQRMSVDRNKRTGKPDNKIPSREELARWLDAKTDFVEERSKVDPGPLKLTDGTPVNNIWKLSTKRNLDSPAGLSGKRNADGHLKEIRLLKTAYDRLELWLGYDHQAAERARKKKRPDWEQFGWTYQKRLIPDACALQHLKQMGFSFGRDRRKRAPEFMQVKPGETKTVREIVLGGKLLPFSTRAGKIRKGDLLLLRLNRKGDIITDKTVPLWTNWYGVTATGEKVEMKSVVLKPSGETPVPVGLSQSVLTRSASSPDVLASVAGLLPAPQQAAKLNLRIPPAPTKPAKSGGSLI